MTDLAVRVVIVASVALVASLVGVVARRGRAMMRRPVSLPGYGPGIVFFSSRGCGPCDGVRRLLNPYPDVMEVVHEEEGTAFPTGVHSVPAIARVDAAGRGWISFGVPTEARLRRWLGDP